MENILATNNLNKRFGSTYALKDVNITIQKGVSLMVGPNGSGKSTLLKIALGLLKPSSGEIKLFGQNPWKEGHTIRKHIGVAFEKATLPKWVEGVEYLKHIARIKELSNADKEVDKMAKLFQIETYYYNNIETYSAGMIQKVALCAAFLGQPKLIILDEPSTNLDAQARTNLTEIIKTYQENLGTDFIISSHFLTELGELCNQLFVFQSGHVIEQGDLESLKQKYFAHAYRIETKEPLKVVEQLHKLKGLQRITLDGRSILIEAVNRSEVEEAVNKLKNEGTQLNVWEEVPSIKALYIKILEANTTQNIA
jgi:ABC-2 type transport system ATP-binding protein